MNEKQYHTDQIAILLATYNGEKYIEEQLESLLNQTYTEWIAYIHDDGSKDGTKIILETYHKRYPEHFQIIDGESTGSAKKNFFYIIQRVEAPIYMCCDQDDVWLPQKIQITYEALKRQQMNQPVLVFSELQVVDSQLNVIAPTMSVYQQLNCNKLSMNRVMIQNVVTGCTMMFNRSLRDMMLKYQDMDHIIMHDWWAALIALQFGEIEFVDTPLIKYRQHSENSVGAKRAGSIAYIKKRLGNIQDIKESLKKTREQTKEFEKCFDLYNDRLIHGYSELNHRCKWNRLIFYRKYNITKTGLTRKIGLFVWG